MSVNMRDMADVLRAAGVPVVEEGDWQHRGTGGSFDAQSIMLHHDASPPGSSSSSADYIIDNLLAQVWLDYWGTWHLIAAGRMNHAGKGSWPGVPTDNANATFIGIETDHTTNEQWTSGQRQYGLRGLLALADWLGIRHSLDDLFRHLIAHKEWAPTRKVDPDPLDMDDLRALILNPPTEAPLQTIQKLSTVVRTLVNEEWRDLKFTTDPEDPTGMYAMGRGPAAWFELNVVVYAQGEPGTVFHLRPYKEGGDGDPSYYNYQDGLILPNGTLALGLSQGGTLAEGKWLRVQGKSDGADVTLTSTRGHAALW